jgi:uncharacterized repeat protein (TIGR01451 family)
MKQSFVQRLGWLLLGVLINAAPVYAQSLGFQLSVTPSAASVLVDNPITYTLNLTNRTGFTLSDLWVTNTFSTPVSIGNVSFTIGNGVDYSGSVFTNSTTVLFDFKNFTPAGLTIGIAQATFTVTPPAASFPTNGFLTNAVVGTAPALQVGSNTETTNVVVQVTGASYRADLAVSLSGFGQGILVGDNLNYAVTVTNSGPDSVPNVLLTNTLPPGTRVISVSRTNSLPGPPNGIMVLNLGTLTNGTSSLVKFTVQPTNAGLLTFAASVGASGLGDPQPTNNSISTNIVVGALVTGQIIATNASPMTLDPQTGLLNQEVRLVNVSTSALPSVRLIVSGLTNWLYNAVGTNGGGPFVVYANTLDVNQSVDLVLEYFVLSRTPISVDNSNYTAVAVPVINPTPPGGTDGAFSVTRTIMLSNGSVLIEFPSVPGASYTILYSTNAAFANPLVAQPPITAPADRVQWIDDGPPKTISPPASAASRFYRVLKK